MPVNYIAALEHLLKSLLNKSIPQMKDFSFCRFHRGGSRVSKSAICNQRSQLFNIFLCDEFRKSELHCHVNWNADLVDS